MRAASAALYPLTEPHSMPRFLSAAALLSLYLLSTLSQAQQQPPRSPARVDLAFVSPPGGSALPAGRAFDVAIQVMQCARRRGGCISCATTPLHCHSPALPLPCCPQLTHSAAPTSAAARCAAPRNVLRVGGPSPRPQRALQPNAAPQPNNKREAESISTQSVVTCSQPMLLTVIVVPPAGSRLFSRVRLHTAGCRRRG